MGYALVKELPTPTERKLLVLIGKVLQNLSNKKEFGNKEKKMLQFNDFIVSNERVMADLFDRLSTVPERVEGTPAQTASFSHVPQKYTDAAICALYKHTERLLPKVLASLNDIEKVNGDDGRQVLRSQYARMLAQYFDRMDLIEIEKKATVVHEVNLNSSDASSSSDAPLQVPTLPKKNLRSQASRPKPLFLLPLPPQPPLPQPAIFLLLLPLCEPHMRTTIA